MIIIIKLNPNCFQLLVNMAQKARSQIKNVLPGEDFRNQVYVGVNDFNSEGNFETVSENFPVEKLPYLHWATYKGRKQPDGGRNQNCATLLAVDRYGMVDVECNNNFAFICELTVRYKKDYVQN